MDRMIGLIGFGEAARTFAVAGQWGARAHVFDVKAQCPADGPAMHAHYVEAGVAGRPSIAEAISPAAIILSLVTADQALAVARSAAACIAPGTYYCDMNSVAPQTKQAAASIIEGVGGHYIDVAVMAPVDPARLAVPLLLSGAPADVASGLLGVMGFANRRVVGDTVGRASSIKMIRSVMVKGVEALTAECMLAASAAGVLDDVLASLDASERPRPWAERADYNLDRMMVHGLRRAAEMEEVVRTLDGLATGSAMTRGTVARQRAIGALGIDEPAIGLEPKIAQWTARKAPAA